MHFAFAFAFVMVVVPLCAHFLLLCEERNWQGNRLRNDMQRLAEQHARDVAALRSDLTRSR